MLLLWSNFSAPVGNCNSHPNAKDPKVRNPRPNSMALQSKSFRAAESRASIDPGALQPFAHGHPSQHHPKIPQHEFAVTTRRDLVAGHCCRQPRDLHHPMIPVTSSLLSSCILSIKTAWPHWGKRLFLGDPGVTNKSSPRYFFLGQIQKEKHRSGKRFVTLDNIFITSANRLSQTLGV